MANVQQHKNSAKIESTFVILSGFYSKSKRLLQWA